MSDDVPGQEPLSGSSEAGGAGGAAFVRSVKDCVSIAGFCLPACPTYSLWGEEMDSPRGRINLVSQLLDGAPLTSAAGEHFDRCLGCMACMTACPSGVAADQDHRGGAGVDGKYFASNPFAGSAEAGDGSLPRPP